MGKPISMKDFCSHYGVSVMAELPEHAFIYPDFYPKGSLLWICKRLDHLSIEDRKTASERFSAIYLQSGYVAAQNFLNDFVRANGFNVVKKQEPQPEQKNEQQQAEYKKTEKKGSGSKILDMSDETRSKWKTQ